MEMVDTEEEITEKLEGGNQNTTLLDRKGKKVIKKYTAKTPKKRLSQESTFLKFCPFAPKVLQKDTKNKRLDMAFIPNAKMSTVEILLKKKVIIDTARVLRITHKRKKFLQNELKEQKDAEKFDYVAVIKKYLSNISDKNFVERIKRDLHKFDILNDKKDYTLIHGDLWSNNILIKDGIYFIDAEHPETKNKYSIGNKYIDIAFFLGLALMKRGLIDKIKFRKKVNMRKLRKAIELFLEYYFLGKNTIVHKKLLMALAFNHLRRISDIDSYVKLGRKEKLDNYDLTYIKYNKEMALVCLDTKTIDNVLDYFFGYWANQEPEKLIVSSS